MCKRITNTALALFLCIIFVASMALPALASGRKAYADDLADARAALDSASAQLSQITAEYEQIQSEISALDAEIAETTQKVLDAQNAMMEGQEVLGNTVTAAYKGNESSSIINVFLMSESLDDFMRNMDYYTAIQEDQAEVIETQRQLRENFNSALDELDAQKDEQQAKLDAAEAKRNEAQQVVSQASSKVSSLEAEQERLAALQAQADAMNQQQSGGNNQPLDENRNTSSGTGGNTAGSGSGNSGSSSGSSENLGSGWRSGVASAYGGKTDPNTPNPGITANGSVCDDNSMGVAIPMSWPNYRSYFGHTVEIRYNGKTVLATINDCGGMGGGSRSLDLQPGVWKAFGFSSCQAWGLRTVSYRIL